MLSTKAELALVDNTLLDPQNSSYPTQPHSIIAKYTISIVTTYIILHCTHQALSPTA